MFGQEQFNDPESREHGQRRNKTSRELPSERRKLGEGGAGSIPGKTIMLKFADSLRALIISSQKTNLKASECGRQRGGQGKGGAS